MTRLAVVGIGNCACALVQALSGIRSGRVRHAPIAGVELPTPANRLEIVAAFDVGTGKVGVQLSDAIFLPPNCTHRYQEVGEIGVTVSPGILADGLIGPLQDIVEVAPECEGRTIEDIVCDLKAARADFVIIYLPVGAQEAANAYAEAALRAGCGLINNTPAMLARDPVWRERYGAEGLILLGDDMKSHIGSTTIHQTLLSVLASRFVTVKNTYQLNIGGNTDFANMRDLARSSAKRLTKTQALADLMPSQVELGVGPSDFIPYLKDRKIGYLHIDGEGYLGMPFSIEVKLEVEDSPNSAAVAIEAVRLASGLAQGVVTEDDAAYAAEELFKSSWIRATRQT